MVYSAEGYCFIRPSLVTTIIFTAPLSTQTMRALEISHQPYPQHNNSIDMGNNLYSKKIKVEANIFIASTIKRLTFAIEKNRC